MEAEPKNYEIAYLISPEVPEEDVFGEAGKITGFLQDAKNLIGHIEEPRRIRLAYPIKKFREAYFGWTRFSGAPEHLPDFEKKLKLEKNVVRFLLVEAEKLQPREERPRQISKTAFAPKPTPSQQEEEKEKMDIGELDKRLEEILGK